MSTKRLLASHTYMQYPKYLGYYLGVNETLLLMELCDKDTYYSDELEDYSGWFSITREWIEFDTGLSEKQQRDALNKLKEMKLVKSKLYETPAKMHYYIDEKALELMLDTAEIAYKERKSQLLQNVSTKYLQNVSTCGAEKDKHTLIKNNKEELNKKSDEPDFSEINSSSISPVNKRRLFRKEMKKLTDDLDSGKDIDKQLKAKKKSPKELFREECLEIIEHEYSDSTAELLTDYFNFISDPKQADSDNKMKVVKTVSGWRKKLDKLEELVKEGYDCEKLIKQSLENKKYVFYPLEITRNNTQYNSKNDEDVQMQTLSGDDVLKELERRESKYGVF